jgi:hypothetical protein
MLGVVTKENPQICVSLSLIIVTFLLSGKLQKVVLIITTKD